MPYIYIGCLGVVGGACGLGAAFAYRSGIGEIVAFLVVVASAVTWRRGYDAMRRIF